MNDVEITQDDVRAARHGYYASLSYADEKIGEVLAAFEACGLAENSVVLFLSDHGDFLGEHGLFYKMSFREHARARSGSWSRLRDASTPGASASLCRCSMCSPTSADIARPGLADELASPVDGRSLLPAARGRRGSRRTVSRSASTWPRACSASMVIDPARPLSLDPHGEPISDQLLRRRQRFSSKLRQRRRRAPSTEPLVDAFPRGGSQSAGPRADRRRASARARRARLAVFRALQQGAPYPWDFPSRRGPASNHAHLATRWTSRCATSSPAFHARSARSPAVCRTFGSPLELEDLVLEPPREGEVDVRLVSPPSICHSDIALLDGASGAAICRPSTAMRSLCPGP